MTLNGVRWALDQMCSKLGFKEEDVVEYHANPKNLTVVYRDEVNPEQLRVASHGWHPDEG